MELFLWIFLPGFVAVSSGVLAWFVMQSRMDVALANQRETLAETRGAMEARKGRGEGFFSQRRPRGGGKRTTQAFDSFLGEITVEQRHYTRENRLLMQNCKSLVLQVQRVLPQSAAFRIGLTRDCAGRRYGRRPPGAGYDGVRQERSEYRGRATGQESAGVGRLVVARLFPLRRRILNQFLDSAMAGAICCWMSSYPIWS